MSGLDWEKVNREKKMTFRPSPRSRPASQRQLDYILGLARQKGQPKAKLPKTLHGASELIDRLLALPDAEVKVDPKFIAEPELAIPGFAQETAIELREHYPQLSPMTATGLVQLFQQIDPFGFAFVLDSLYNESTPEEPNALLLFLLRRFLSELSHITTDDEHALVPG